MSFWIETGFAVYAINYAFLAGRTLPWLTGMTAEFDKNNYTIPYICLINEGIRRNKQIPISYNDFMGGYTIYTLDCTPARHLSVSGDDESGENPRAEGSLELTCTFSTPPSDPLTFVVLCYFPTTVTLDANRKFQIGDNEATASIMNRQSGQRSF